MSRIGKKPIAIPQGVDVKVAGSEIIVKGAKGEVKQALHHLISVEVKDGNLTVDVKNHEDRKQKALWGLFRSLLNNMVLGVSTGFTKQLEINGIGFKAAVSGNKLILNVGFSHPVEYVPTPDIKLAVEKNTITVSGIDKQRVGQTAAEIRAIKKPEPYKGKGIKYSDEVIRRKAGKVVKGAGA